MATKSTRTPAKTQRVTITPQPAATVALVGEIEGVVTVKSVNLFAGTLDPVLDITEPADGAGLWTVPSNLLDAYRQARADLMRAQESILAALHTTGQTPPWPFKGCSVNDTRMVNAAPAPVTHIALPTLDAAAVIDDRPLHSLLGLLDSEADEER